MGEQVQKPHYKKIYDFALQQHGDVEVARKKYRSMREAASALMKPGEPLHGWSPDQIEWQQVLAVRESLKRARGHIAPKQEVADAQGDNDVVVLDDPAIPAAAAAAAASAAITAPGTASAAVGVAGHHENTDTEQPPHKKQHLMPPLIYPVTDEQVAELSTEQLSNTPLATWPVPELHTFNTNISKRENQLQDELIMRTREIRTYKAQVSRMRALVDSTLDSAERELTSGLVADAVGSQFTADIAPILAQGKSQAKKLAEQLLNSDEQKAVTRELLILQAKVNTIKECKAEVQRAIALEEVAYGTADADCADQTKQRAGGFRGQVSKYEETSFATQCTAATGATGSTLRRLFGWGRW